MKDRYRDAVIGMAAIAGVLACVAMLLAFGSLRELSRDAYDVTIRLNHAGGLRYGSQITLDGVPIGVVETVVLEMDETNPVRLTCRLDEWVRLPVDHLVQVETALIGGGTRLSILSLDPNGGRSVFTRDDVPVLTGKFMTLDETLIQALDLKMLPVTESFKEVGALASVYGDLGRRLNDMVGADPDDEEGLAASVVRINRTLAEAERAFNIAGDWLGDEQLREDAKQAVFKANLFIERAADAAVAAGELATELGREAPAFMARLASTADAVDATLAEVREVIGKAGNGEGTVGRLLNDPALYDDLDDAARRLDATLATLGTLIEAIKAEGVKVEF
ncbi:MAG: MlaD family protein [Planctomycetota bacterium]|nr:MlaD family protein [Planctomycetota bacterium]MDA1027051.1 MlaD family protein [Planctomycetota bacterium]